MLFFNKTMQELKYNQITQIKSPNPTFLALKTQIISFQFKSYLKKKKIIIIPHCPIGEVTM